MLRQMLTRKFEQRIRKTIYNNLFGLLIAGVVLVPMVALVTTAAIQHFSDYYSSSSKRIENAESEIRSLKMQLDSIRKSPVTSTETKP